MDASPKIHEFDDCLEGRHRPRAAEPRRSPLTPERVEQLRNRIRERAYDTDSVLAVTAKEILRSRDL